MPVEKKIKYGLPWDIVTRNMDIEMFCIQRGGQWKNSKGQTVGEGLFHHYKELQKILWPEDDHHRWSDLILKEILESTILAIMGSKDSGKTRCMAKYALTDYFCFPNETLIIMSSTDVRGLELRVWGDLKGLYQRAKDRFSDLPGHLIDSKHAITTQNIKEHEVRDMRKGINCVPTMSSGGSFVGLGKLVGLKQKRRRLLADEFQFMKSGMLESVANMNSGNFKGVFVGNPIGEGDPLDKVAEPKGGWGTEGDVTKTTV